MKKNLLLFFTALCLYTLPVKAQYLTSSQSSQAVEKVLENIISQNGIAEVLILVDNDLNSKLLEDIGVVVQTKAGKVWTALVPVNKMQELLKVKGVLMVESPSKFQSMRLKMDSARISMQTNKIEQAQSLPMAYSGKGVVIGVVDIGFDTRHPAFYFKDSTTTRISRIWQQNYNDGPAPEGFSYGTERKGEEVFNDLDLHGSHGTHVASIAAGSGIGSPNLKFKGVAPDAELVFVSIKYYDSTLPGSALSDYLIANAAIIDAYAYIFNYAKSVGKPAVINLSWGMHTGPHDGTSLFDLATNALVKEGNILVGAAGNEGTNNMHFDAMLQNDTVSTLCIENQRNNNSNEEVYVDIWGSGNSKFSLSVTILDTFGNIVHQSPYTATEQADNKEFVFAVQGGDFKINKHITPIYVPNNKPNVLLWVQNPNPRLYVIQLNITSSYSQIHAWNSGGIYRYTSGSFRNRIGNLDLSSSLVSGNTRYTVGENGGTSKSVVTVGSYTAKNFYVGIFGDTFNDRNYSSIGQITPFSSRGPTADGRIKPDILAPGMDVAAAIYLQQYPGWAWNRLVSLEPFKNDSFAYGVFSGTSMASPQVTGVVALMLQANPALTPAQIIHIIKQTAIVDAATGNVPNTNAGNGKINAYEAVKEALRVVSSKGLQVKHEVLVYPNPAQTRINIESDSEIKQIELLDIQGRGLRKFAIEPSLKQVLDVSGVGKGIYLLKVDGTVYRLLLD